MSNVVQFLEALAHNPKQLTAEGFAKVVAKTELEPAVKKALLDRDVIRLNAVLGGRSNVMCLIVPAENDEPQEGEEQEGDDQTPNQDTTSRAA